ncbi:hypothetical protein KGF57_001352 [Candida theae]|uniref:L-type lectin-like domain-containing protein n=1 Tax=Candida theae TaxID=1198502 RepID=A0AAD5BH83_9ASCO|nr:uncharacterized protein KGF57_001352 [Candida theae]KAI5962912.1 hypothetical protein KGF57_001352 [Candida theae]
MRSFKSILFNSVLATALVPNVNIEQQNNRGVDPSLESVSLPNLLTIESISQVKNYESSGVTFEQGRISMSQNGVLWSKSHIPSKEFTAEIIFRSTGKSQDIQFPENGLNVWLLDDKKSQGLDQYDGFKFAINNVDTQGLKIFNNDGSKNAENGLDVSIGDCQFRYLESDVPFTLRVSYSDDSWFKVQVDNNLCFKTDKITLPQNQNFKLGITSNTNPQSQENFEILAVKVWDKLTEDAIDDHGLMVDGELKVDVKKVVDTPQSNRDEDHVSPRVVRESLMERARKHREEMERLQQQGGSSPNTDLSSILNKLSHLEHLVNELPKNFNPLSSSGNQDGQIDRLSQSQSDINNAIKETHETIRELKETFVQQYAQLLQAVSDLNHKVIGEVREQHFGMEEIGKKVDLLMNEHKEVQHQYRKQNDQMSQKSAHGGSHTESTVDKLIRWIIIPLLIVLLALVVFVYRLRHDIKHSKLL